MKKLIRDNIPDIIKNKWEKCEFYIADDIEYSIELLKKIVEESIEVKKAKNKKELTEELADVIEVIHSICDNKSISIDDIEKARIKKKKEKWWFSKKIIFKYT